MAEKPSHLEQDIDPDLFEPLLQALAALSSVAGLATAWMQLKAESSRQQREMQKFQFKQFINDMQRSHDDIFRDLSDIIDIFRDAQIKNNKNLSETKIGFGNAAFQFNHDEFDHFKQLSLRVSQNYTMLKGHCFNLQTILRHQRAPGEIMLQNSLETLNDNINDILFNSSDFDDALRKLERARKAVDHFIESLRQLSSSAN